MDFKLPIMFLFEDLVNTVMLLLLIFYCLLFAVEYFVLCSFSHAIVCRLPLNLAFCMSKHVLFVCGAKLNYIKYRQV